MAVDVGYTDQPLTVRWPEQTDYVLELAYEAGRFDERRRAATAAAELDERWRTAGATWYRDWIADSIARAERIAADNPAATWRGRYPGGPVDFETGALA